MVEMRAVVKVELKGGQKAAHSAVLMAAWTAEQRVDLMAEPMVGYSESRSAAALAEMKADSMVAEMAAR